MNNMEMNTLASQQIKLLETQVKFYAGLIQQNMSKVLDPTNNNVKKEFPAIKQEPLPVKEEVVLVEDGENQISNPPSPLCNFKDGRQMNLVFEDYLPWDQFKEELSKPFMLLVDPQESGLKKRRSLPLVDHINNLSNNWQKCPYQTYSEIEKYQRKTAELFLQKLIEFCKTPTEELSSPHRLQNLMELQYIACIKLVETYTRHLRVETGSSWEEHERAFKRRRKEPGREVVK